MQVITKIKGAWSRLYMASMLLLIPSSSFADVQGMMRNLQSAILDVLAPLVCISGIIFSGFKMAMGDESAKRLMFFSCLGTVFVFTAPSILSFLQTRVAS